MSSDSNEPVVSAPGREAEGERHPRTSTTAAIKREKINTGTVFERFAALATAIDAGNPGDVFAISYEVGDTSVILETRLIGGHKAQTYARTIDDVFLFGDTYDVSGLPDEAVAAAIGDATAALVSARDTASTITTPIHTTDL